jgi:hypothetical protein
LLNCSNMNSNSKTPIKNTLQNMVNKDQELTPLSKLKNVLTRDFKEPP